MKTSLQLDPNQKKALLEHYRKQQKNTRTQQVLYPALAACLILAFIFRPTTTLRESSISTIDLAQVNQIEKQVDELFTLHRDIKNQSLNQKSKKLSSNLKSHLKPSLSSRLRKSKQKIKSLKQKLT